MTVKELIKELQKFPQHLPVYSRCDYDWVMGVSLATNEDRESVELE